MKVPILFLDALKPTVYLILYSIMNFGGNSPQIYPPRVSRIYLSSFLTMRTPATIGHCGWSFSPRLSQRHWQEFQGRICQVFSTPWDLYLILNGQVLRFSLSIISSIWGFNFFKPCFALLIPVNKCFSLGENEDDQSWTLFSDRYQPNTFIPKGNPVLSSSLGLNMTNDFFY